MRLYAGPLARKHIEAHGLSPHHIRAVLGAAGGPKGLILNGLDRFVFGDWLRTDALSRPDHDSIQLVGASIGAWRMAAAAMDDPQRAFTALAHGYIHQDYPIEPGQTRPTAAQISRAFGQTIREFFAGQIAQIVSHPRYRLSIVTAHGRHLLRREDRLWTAVGYAGAAMSNAVHRRALGAWLERVVFSSPVPGLRADPRLCAPRDLPTRDVALTPANFEPALLASCSVPFVLSAVHDIPGAPPGAYWDGGITDYHLHWDSRGLGDGGVVLYPHFQRAVVPGWLDKPWKRRHLPTPWLDRVLLLAPDPEWVRRLPGGKLPDRKDFKTYAADPAARMQHWRQAVAEADRLADEFSAWLHTGDPAALDPL